MTSFQLSKRSNAFVTSQMFAKNKTGTILVTATANGRTFPGGVVQRSSLHTTAETPTLHLHSLHFPASFHEGRVYSDGNFDMTGGSFNLGLPAGWHRVTVRVKGVCAPFRMENSYQRQVFNSVFEDPLPPYFVLNGTGVHGTFPDQTFTARNNFAEVADEPFTRGIFPSPNQYIVVNQGTGDDPIEIDRFIEFSLNASLGNIVGLTALGAAVWSIRNCYVGGTLPDGISLFPFPISAPGTLINPQPASIQKINPGINPTSLLPPFAPMISAGSVASTYMVQMQLYGSRPDTQARDYVISDS